MTPTAVRNGAFFRAIHLLGAAAWLFMAVATIVGWTPVQPLVAAIAMVLLAAHLVQRAFE